MFDHFPKYHKKILLGDFHATVGRENIFKLTDRNVGVNQDSNDNGVRIINIATLKNVIVKNVMFPHRNIHKYTCTSHR